MSGGGTNDLPSPAGLPTGGEFLLSLLQKPPHNHGPQSQPPPPLQTQLQNLTLDPAVASVGPTVPFPTASKSGRDLAPPRPHTLSPPLQPNPYPHNYFNFSPPGNNFPGKFPSMDDFGRFGFDLRGRVAPPHSLAHHSKQHYDHQQREHHNNNMRFASSTPSEVHTFSMLPNGGDSKIDSYRLGSLEERETGLVSGNFVSNRIENSRQFSSQRGGSGLGSGSGVSVNLQSHGLRRENFDTREQDWKVIGKGRQGSGGNHRGTPPSGFGGKLSVGGDKDFGGRRWGFQHDEDGYRNSYRELNNRNVGTSNGEVKLRRFSGDDGRERSEQSSRGRGLIGQLERPGPPAGSNLLSVSPSDAEDSLFELARESGEDETLGAGECDDYVEKLADSLLHEDELDGKNDKKHHRRDKDFRSDTRGKHLLTQRMRNLKRYMECRIDIYRLDAPFLEIYKTLIPPEEEKAKQKQLLTLLEKLVTKEWPEAQLFLYGSCANSFGVCKSDIDVCLAIQDTEIDKSEVLLKLAEILESDNLQNVQALTRARVPIVKLMDPATGISCDICINNVLAVVNTKLLRDYAQIDPRLRQLAFIVKHWAKSRGVNETYQGTLSSYAYVLMCIHFLQQQRPAILPCLQEMEKTYSVTVDDIECSYFDQVEKLRGFGSHNRETIAQLVWAFFHYWAYRHDYANSVISVRTGSLLSKQSKDWTRRIGNDRHLICIEDPFDTSHDLGRVVDKFSIKVLREEFERAAEIMQYDPNPCVTLFEPYVPSSNPW